MIYSNVKAQSKKIKSIPIGWREWVYLPDYRNFALKAKIDTGARTSAIHATHIDEYQEKNQDWVRFRLYQSEKFIKIKAKLIKHKKIISSFGESEIRPLIKLKIKLGNRSWFTEVTLTTRNKMTYPMLIGRSSLMKKYLIHSHKSYMTGKNQSKTK